MTFVKADRCRPFPRADEAEREIRSPSLAYIQFAILVIGTAGVVVTCPFDFFHGNFLLGKEGRAFLEQPLWVKIGIVVAALIFPYNITMTVLKGRKTAITNILLLGLRGLALLFPFAFYNPSNLSRDKQYWWYVVHFWVEGAWELVMASILTCLMLKRDRVYLLGCKEFGEPMGPTVKARIASLRPGSTAVPARRCAMSPPISRVRHAGAACSASLPTASRTTSTVPKAATGSRTAAWPSDSTCCPRCDSGLVPRRRRILFGEGPERGDIVNRGS